MIHHHQPKPEDKPHKLRGLRPRTPLFVPHGIRIAEFDDFADRAG
jgi:hypothetical protein